MQKVLSLENSLRIMGDFILEVGGTCKEKRFFMLFFYLLVCFSLLPATGYSQSSDEMPLFWLEPTGEVRETDGAVSEKVYLRSRDRAFDFSRVLNLQAFYCDDQEQEQPQYFLLPLEMDETGCFLQVKTRTRYAYHVVMIGEYEGEYLIAQISFRLRAALRQPQEEVDGIQGTLPSVPLLVLPYFSWPQTGQKFPLTYETKGEKSVVSNIQLWDSWTGVSIELQPDDEGIFQFVPAHDQILNQSSSSAVKLLVVSAQSTNGNQLYRNSRTILVHRSNAAYKNLWGGVIFFIIVLGGSILFIAIYRRRERY